MRAKETRIFAFVKVSYLGLAKNVNRVFMTFALPNPYVVRGRRQAHARA